VKGLGAGRDVNKGDTWDARDGVEVKSNAILFVEQNC